MQVKKTDHQNAAYRLTLRLKVNVDGGNGKWAWSSDKHVNSQTQTHRQTNGRYQTYYLPCITIDKHHQVIFIGLTQLISCLRSQTTILHIVYSFFLIGVPFHEVTLCDFEACPHNEKPPEKGAILHLRHHRRGRAIMAILVTLCKNMISSLNLTP